MHFSNKLEQLSIYNQVICGVGPMVLKVFKMFKKSNNVDIYIAMMSHYRL